MLLALENRRHPFALAQECSNFGVDPLGKRARFRNEEDRLVAAADSPKHLFENSITSRHVSCGHPCSNVKTLDLFCDGLCYPGIARGVTYEQLVTFFRPLSYCGPANVFHFNNLSGN